MAKNKLLAHQSGRLRSDALAPCPCGRAMLRHSPLPVADCCGRFMGLDSTPPPDAEALMRSRYTAFACGNTDYLLATWHPGTRPAALELEPAVQWLGLELRNHRVLDATHAEVEFVACSRLHGRATRLHERSRFVREPDAADVWRWYYVDGDML